MPGDQRVADAKTRAEGYKEGMEKGIGLGISYWELYRKVHRIINSADEKEESDEKRKILSEAKDYAEATYVFLENNPDSETLKKQQEGLESLAEDKGFVMTKKGIFLDNL